MKTIKKTISYLILAILFASTLASGQNIGIEHEGEIILPDVDFTPSPSVDIIRANGFVYVYTFKGIQIYEEDENENTIFVGSIDFGSEHGRFAPMYFKSSHYAADPVFMAYNPNSQLLYFVTPELVVMSVSTAQLDTQPNVVLPPTLVQMDMDNKTLHAYTKLVYDNQRKRLYWMARAMNDNMHSFDAYFGIFEQDNDGEWTSIYQESQDGSNTGDYANLMNTFVINTNTDPDVDKFYMCRKFKIEEWTIDQQVAENTDFIETHDQERNSKMIFINEKNLLLVFPLMIDDCDNDNTDSFIYQINTQSFNYNNDNLELAPSKKILDAVYVSGSGNDDGELLLCYSDDCCKQAVQGDNTPIHHDVAYYHYDNEKNIFTFSGLLYTMKGDEIDIDGKTNLNRPFKLTGTTGGDIVLSKKNEIVLLSKSSSGGGYTHSSIYYARDNFFGKGAIDASGNIFIVNTVKSGFEKISADFNYQSHIKTSYPVYNILHNHLNNKLYFFNRLASAGTGFYAYDIETGTQTFIETSKAIGDLIYNPINNQILVSEYAPSDENNAHILVYDAVNPSSATTLSYSDDGGYFDFAGRMFAAPNGKIYISMNMRADDNLPKIVVIDGSSYDKLLTVASGILSFPPEYCSSFQSFYCYNPYDKKVYATFGIYFPSFNQPYQTSYNSSLYSNMEPFEFLPTGNYSKLVEIGEDAISTNRYDINSPSEIICSTPLAGQDNDYEGVLFINTATISDDFLTGGLRIFDCATNEFITIEKDNRIHEIYDMTYCPLTESLYAFNIEEIEVNNIANQKITHVFKVSEDGTYTDIWQQDGVAASINYNEFDSQLYVYYRGQYKMLGLNQDYAKIFTLDPFVENNAKTGDINLPYMNMYPEMEPQANHPHFNPYNNKAYFPNGMHSSVSVVGFVAKEALTLTVRPNWISIPRHLGNLGQNDNAYWPTNQVFTQNTIQNGFQTLNLKRYHVEPTPPHSAEYKYADYIPYPEPAWSYTPDYTNQNIYSTRGYKLEYTPNDEEKLLYMEGFVEDPETYIQLYENNMNWVGYFLHEEQDAFNALGASVLTDLTEVWGQDFYCYRRNGIIQDGPTHGSIEGTYWVCDQTRRTVHYGDMLSLTSMATTNFQWQGTGTPPMEELRPIVSYFEYDETLAYTPIIIEIDYNENPMELGAFIDTLCVGAVALLPEDSAVILRAYLEEGYAPEDIVFQEYYGTKTSNNNVVANYSVFNKMTEKFENRPLTGKVGNELVYISFKDKKVDDNEVGEIDINFWPNPAHDQLNYSFYADSDGHLNISLYGINGKIVSVLIDKVCEKGAVYGITELKGLSGHISQGIYFVKTKFGNSITTKKIVVQ